MSRAIPQPTDGGEAGFTIIEVLIALAMVAVSIVAIGSVMSTSLRGVTSLERHVALMQTVRAVMTTEIAPHADLVLGSSSGRISDYQWRVDVAPLGDDWVVSGADVAWVPDLVKVRVRSPSGATIDVQTVRLMRRPAQ